MLPCKKDSKINVMLTVEEAQALVMAEVRPLPAETVPFADAHGRVLREDVLADVDLPPWDNSAMDGYAVRADDIANAPVQLRVVGDVAAGRVAKERLEPGTAFRIMTGAPVPDGADTVVQVELTDGGIEQVTIEKALARGTNIRRLGGDIRAGDVVLRAGVWIGAVEMAVLAGVHKREVRVGRRPTAAILSTGDELVEPGEDYAPGKIVNTNGPLLTALARECGAVVRPLGIVRDTREATIAALEEAASADFVITSGGVSVGAYDFVKEALDALGAHTKFWRVAMKPGKPVVVSRLRDTLFFGLPGNPVSSFVSFHLFVAPALRKAAGQERELLPVASTRVTAPLRGTEGRRVYVRVNVTLKDFELVSTPLASQGSGSLSSMIDANGLAIVEDGVSYDANSLVPTLLIALPGAHP